MRLASRVLTASTTRGYAVAVAILTWYGSTNGARQHTAVSYVAIRNLPKYSRSCMIEAKIDPIHRAAALQRSLYSARMAPWLSRSDRPEVMSFNYYRA